MNIKDYIDYVREYLISEYGEVKSEWEITLKLLEDNLILYEDIRQCLNQYGIYDASSGKKTHLLSTLKEISATILKLIQKLGISPYDYARIKKETIDDTDSFIDSLTNEE